MTHHPYLPVVYRLAFKVRFEGVRSYCPIDGIVLPNSGMATKILNPSPPPPSPPPFNSRFQCRQLGYKLQGEKGIFYFKCRKDI